MSDNEREQRYAEAIHGSWTHSIKEWNAWDVLAPVVMAVADAEQTELRAALVNMDRLVTEANADAEAAERALADERAKVANWLGRAWDAGNAMGLDGYVGPNRGEDPDPEAIRGRERYVEKALAALAGPESEATA